MCLWSPLWSQLEFERLCSRCLWLTLRPAPRTLWHSCLQQYSTVQYRGLRVNFIHVHRHHFCVLQCRRLNNKNGLCVYALVLLTVLCRSGQPNSDTNTSHCTIILQVSQFFRTLYCTVRVSAALLCISLWLWCCSLNVAWLFSQPLSVCSEHELLWWWSPLESFRVSCNL